MATTTPATGWPIPQGTDDPDVVDDMTKLARAIEKNAIGIYNTPTDRDTKTAAAGVVKGMFAFTADLNKLWFYDGAAWVAFPPAQPTIRSGTAAPNDAVGVDGDVYYRY